MRPLASALIVALLVLASILAGCYVPKPVGHAELHVAASGEFTFNGSAASPAGLPGRIAAAMPSGGDLIVQIEAAPSAKTEAIQSAVAAVKLAHARVAFAAEGKAQ